MPISYQTYQLRAGNIANLTLVDRDLAEPKDDEVTVEVEAIGLNFADIFAIFGLYGATPKGVFTPGLEYAGRIIRKGKAVPNRQVGDRVMGVTRFGGYTTHLNTEYSYTIPLPDDWSFGEGAAYLVQVLTAYYGLVKLGDLQHHQTVLIHSAAGGVGLLANRIAKKYQAYTIGSVGSSNKIDVCKEEGYDAVIVRSKHFARDLRNALNNRDLNIVMECIGGKIFTAGFEALAPQGRSIIYGAARYASPGKRPNYPKLLYKHATRPKIDPQNLAEINKGLLGFNLIYLYDKVELMYELLQEIEMLEIGKPMIGHTFSFDKLPDAVKLFQSGKTIGKVVVDV